GLAVAADVERDRAAACPGEGRDPAGLHPVHLLGRGKAVDENDRLARALVEKGNLHGSVLKARHARHEPEWEGGKPMGWPPRPPRPFAAWQPGAPCGGGLHAA